MNKPSVKRGTRSSKRRLHHSPCALIAPFLGACALQLAVHGALAATAAGADQSGDQQLGEVIVTAQKIPQRAFDVPMSLDVVSAGELAQLRITNLNDLQYAVPGLSVQGGDQHRIILRGVGNLSGTGPLVSQYIDEADTTSEGTAGGSGFTARDGGMYDLQRVEVLRGPQGTLYGEGALGGTIRFITNKPALDRFEMNADVSALFTQHGAPSQRIDAVVNTPLVPGTVGLRVAGEFDHEGGWVDQPAANLKNINSEDLTDVRIEGLWQPTEHFKALVTQVIHRDSSGLDYGEVTPGEFTQVFNQTTTPNAQLSSNLSNLTLTYDFSIAQILSSSTYFNNNWHQLNFSEVFPFSFGTYAELLPNYRVSDEDFSQDLRLSSTGNGPWQWTVGALFKRYWDHLDEPVYYYGLQGNLPPPIPIGYFVRDVSKSSSGFANTSYKLMGRLTIGAGVRYFKDQRTYGALGSPSEQATFTSSDPRVFLQYQWSPHVNTYASAAKGFRSGGFNVEGQPPFGPETLWTYELGSKLFMPRNGVRANADVFYSNYSNFVTSIPHLPLNIASNAGKARIKGVEADLLWMPVDQWQFSVNGDYLDATFVTVYRSLTAYSPGDQLPLVSKYMFTGSVERKFLWNVKPGYIRLNYSEISPQQYRSPLLPLETSDLIRRLDFSMGLQWSQQLRLEVFAQNLLDDRGYLDPYPLFRDATRARPRTFGVDFGVAFN